MKQQITPSGDWNGKPLYQMKVGTMPASVAIIKRVTAFAVGDVIEFKEYNWNTPPRNLRWKRAIIRSIESDRLYVSLH